MLIYLPWVFSSFFLEAWHSVRPRRILLSPSVIVRIPAMPSIASLSHHWRHTRSSQDQQPLCAEKFGSCVSPGNGNPTIRVQADQGHGQLSADLEWVWRGSWAPPLRGGGIMQVNLSRQDEVVHGPIFHVGEKINGLFGLADKAWYLQCVPAHPVGCSVALTGEPVR